MENAIVERIISDAEKEAKSIIEQAEQRAAQTVAEANTRAERNAAGVRAEVKQKSDSLTEGKAATARLDGAKILLAEKRGVIDEVYARALKGLNGLKEADALYLANRLLTAYAEEGDEIVFAESYPFAQGVSKLAVVKEKKLIVSNARTKLDGGFKLVGKNCDKDLSMGALIAADRDVYQAELAAKIFNTD